MVQEHIIKVMTFKESGKYYDEFEVKVLSDNNWYSVSEAVRECKKTFKVQTDMDWLIGISEEGLSLEVSNGIYPMILKG